MYIYNTVIQFSWIHICWVNGCAHAHYVPTDNKSLKVVVCQAGQLGQKMMFKLSWLKKIPRKKLEIPKCEVVLLQLHRFHDQSRQPPGILCRYCRAQISPHM